MDNFDFNKLHDEKANTDHFTVRIDKAVEKAAQSMVDDAVSGFYFNGKDLDTYQGKEAASGQWEYAVEGIESIVESANTGDSIIDDGLEVVLYSVYGNDLVNFTAVDKPETINNVISSIEKVVDEEVRDGYVPAEARDDTILNAMRKVGSEAEARSRSEFTAAIKADGHGIAADIVYDLGEKAQAASPDYIVEKMMKTPWKVLGISQNDYDGIMEHGGPTEEVVEKAFAPGGSAFEAFLAEIENVGLDANENYDALLALEELDQNQFVHAEVKAVLTETYDVIWDSVSSALQSKF